MTGFKDTDERELERLLTGRVPTSDEGLADVADFVRDLRTAYPEEAVPGPVEADHIAAMVAAAQLLAEGDGPAMEPAGNARGFARILSVLPKWSRMPAYRRLPRVHLAAKLALASAAFLMLFCGLALAGTLPGPVQGFASQAASAVGIHIPHPNKPAVAPAASAAASPTAKPSPSRAAHAVDVQGQRGSKDQGAGRQQNQNQSGNQGQQQTPGQGDGQHQTQSQGGGQDQSQNQDQIRPQQQNQPQDQSGSND